MGVFYFKIENRRTILNKALITEIVYIRLLTVTVEYTLKLAGVCNVVCENFAKVCYVNNFEKIYPTFDNLVLLHF